jgi:hypothetical protein
MKYTFLAIVFAAVIVAVVGYIVLSAKDAPQTSAPAQATGQKKAAPGSDKTSASQSSNATTPEVKNALSDIKFPGQDATKEEYSAFNEKVYNMSVAVNKITITDCVADPLVIRVPKASQFTIHNKDSKEHRLSNLGSQTPVVLPAGGDVQVTLKDIGVYGYACDATAQRSLPAGIVAVMDAK